MDTRGLGFLWLIGLAVPPDKAVVLAELPEVGFQPPSVTDQVAQPGMAVVVADISELELRLPWATDQLVLPGMAVVVAELPGLGSRFL